MKKTNKEISSFPHTWSNCHIRSTYQTISQIRWTELNLHSVQSAMFGTQSGCLSGRIFERPRISSQEPEDNQVSGDCGEIFIGGMLSRLVSSSSSVPELTFHGVGRCLHVKSLLGKGVAKAWNGQFADHVSALSLSWQILWMFQANWPMKRFPLPMCSAARRFRSWGGGGGGRGGVGFS